MVWRSAFPLLLLFLTACSAPSVNDVLIVGHAGMGSDDDRMPNSSEAVLSAMDLGLHGVELDVQMTSDGVLVVYHDKALGTSTNCTGIVNLMPWQDLQECEPKAPGAAGLERLDSLLMRAATHAPDVDFTLDCKLFAAGDWWSYLETFTDALLRLEEIPVLKGRLLVECQVDPFLQLLGTKKSRMPRFRYTRNADETIPLAKKYGYNGITVHYARITTEQVALAKSVGLEVTMFGAGNRWSHWRALRKEPDRLQSDAPELLMK